MASRRLAPNGERVEWELVEIVEAAGEEWAEYELGDGSSIRTKTVLSQVKKAVDENGDTVFDENGEPYFSVQFESATELVEQGESPQQ